MGWLRLDDGFAMHPKISALSDRDYRAWTKVLLYCARYRTEGDVPDYAFRQLGIATKTRQKFVAVGLLDVDEDGVATVHDWADFNPPDPTNAERQKRWRERQKEAKRNDAVTASVTESTVTPAVTVTPPRALAGARDPSTSTSELPTAEALALEADRSELPANGLPIEKERVTINLLAAIGSDADADTPQIIRALAARLPEGSLAKVLESLGNAKPRNRAAYAVGALKSEIEERLPPVPKTATLRKDPERYVRELGCRMDAEALDDVLLEIVPDKQERARLAKLAEELRSA